MKSDGEFGLCVWHKEEEGAAGDFWRKGRSKLFSVPAVDELNLLSSIGHSLYTNCTPHVLGGGACTSNDPTRRICFVTFFGGLQRVICRGILVLGGVGVWLVGFFFLSMIS